MPKRSARFLPWLAGIAIFALAVVALSHFTGPSPPEDTALTKTTAPEEPRVPEFRGFAKTASSPHFCDASLWGGIDEIVREVKPGEARVNEQAWERLDVRTRVAVASYLSRCTQAGASIEIVARASKKPLAFYDPEDGYRRPE